jgi:hypothetical protein
MVVGLIVGAGGGLLAARIGSYGKESTAHRRPTREATLEKLTLELHLTPAQKDTLDAILDRGARRMRELSQTVRPQFRAIKEETRDQIRGILDAGQRDAFERLVEKEDQQREAQKRSGAMSGGRPAGRG